MRAQPKVVPPLSRLILRLRAAILIFSNRPAFLDSIEGCESVQTSALVEGMCLDVFEYDGDQYFTDYNLCPAGQGCHYDDGTCAAERSKGHLVIQSTARLVSL